MEENSSKNEADFVFDTSAFLSLESIFLLEQTLTDFSIVTTTTADKELNHFAQHDDELGNIAKRVLRLRTLFKTEKIYLKQQLSYVSTTDEELYNLALFKNIPLITDDTKLIHHTRGKIKRTFSTIFLRIFIQTNDLTKNEALQKLEQMRTIRNWQNNIIYLSAKTELENINE